MALEDENAVDFDESAPSGDEDILDQEELQEEELDEEDESQEDDDDFVETDNPNVQKRFDRLTAEKHQARQEAEEYRKRVEQAEREAEELRKRLAQDTVKSDEEVLKAEPPDEDDFETLAEYNDAIAKHWRRVGEAEARIQTRKQQEEQEQQASLERVYSNYQAQTNEVRKKYEDFDAVASQVNLHPSIQMKIIEMDKGAEVTYALGKIHKDLLGELQDARTMAQVERILGKVEDRVSRVPKPKKITAAGSSLESPSRGGGTRPPRDSFEKKYPGAIIK